MWRDFLERVWGFDAGWAFIARSGKGPFQQRAYEYPKQFDSLLKDLTEASEQENVYFCPHLFSQPKSRDKGKAKEVRTLWIDKDEGYPEDIQPEPTICWQTSEGRYQAVWLLEKPIDPKIAERVNRHLTYTSKGDKGGWHLGKVIRLPKSYNFKHSPPQEGVLLWDDGPKYSIGELAPEEVFKGDLSSTLPKDSQELPDELPDVEQVLKQYGSKIPQAVWNLLNESPDKGADWSDSLWRIERLLIEAGLPLEAIFVLARDSAWNKYRRDGRPDEQLWLEIVKAAESEKTVVPESDKLPWVGLNTLMAHSEAPRWLVEGIWMEKNVGWMAGVGKSYKSVMSLDLALSIATGTPFLGQFHVSEPGPVLMVQEEDPLWRVAHRIQAMAEVKGISTIKVKEEATGITFDVPSNKSIPIHIAVGGGFSFTSEDKLKALEEALEYYRPRILFLDPLFMLTPGMDEFKAGEIVKVLNLMKHWRNKYECAICCVHHYNKGGNGDGRSRLYGSMAFYAWSENSLFISREEDTNAVVIDRDIKDALVDDKIKVEFHDIDENYSFTIGDAPKVSKKSKAYKTVENLLKNHYEPGSSGEKQDIVTITKLSEKSVTAVLRAMEAENLVYTHNEGTGGRLLFILTGIHDDNSDEEEGVDFTL